MQRNGARQQFTPCWPAGVLFNPVLTPNLHIGDFFVARAGSRVVGCLALWDQMPFKQTLVRGYGGSLAHWRPLISGLSRWVGLPYLPAVNTPLRSCYASHLAIDEDNPQIFSALLRAVCNETVRHGFHYLLLGLSETNPLRPLVTRRYLHLTYLSLLYLVAWEDGLQAVEQVDRRVPGLEIAVL